MRKSFFLTTIAALMPLVAHTTTIHVPADSLTIEAGIDAILSRA
jgi:hypothetical protein